jgi:hypothetical protein
MKPSQPSANMWWTGRRDADWRGGQALQLLLVAPGAGARSGGVAHQRRMGSRRSAVAGARNGAAATFMLPPDLVEPVAGKPALSTAHPGMQAALPFVDDFLPVHNLVSLEQLGANWRCLARAALSDDSGLEPSDLIGSATAPGWQASGAVHADRGMAYSRDARRLSGVWQPVAAEA